MNFKFYLKLTLLQYVETIFARLHIIVLVALYAYKVVNKPEITKVPISNSKKRKEDIAKSEKTQSSYTREKIELIVKNYIIDNPDTLERKYYNQLRGQINTLKTIEMK